MRILHDLTGIKIGVYHHKLGYHPQQLGFHRWKTGMWPTNTNQDGDLNDLYIDLCYQWKGFPTGKNGNVQQPWLGFPFFPSESHSEIPGFGKKSNVRRPDLVASGGSQAFHGAKWVFTRRAAAWLWSQGTPCVGGASKKKYQEWLISHYYLMNHIEWK